MKAEKITIECAITKSRAYQSARIGLVMEVTMEEGESRQQATEKAIDWTTKLTEKKAEEALQLILP